MKPVEQRPYEKNSLSDRIKNLSVLAFFTVMLAIVSVIVMDILIYAISSFALNKTDSFTLVFKYGVLFFVIAAFLLTVFKRIRSYRRNNMPSGKIAAYLIKTPAKAAAVGIVLVFISAAVIFLLWLIFSANNKFINLIMNA